MQVLSWMVLVLFLLSGVMPGWFHACDLLHHHRVLQTSVSDSAFAPVADGPVYSDVTSDEYRAAVCAKLDVLSTSSKKFET